MGSYLFNFSTYLPPYEASQENTLKWLENLHQKRTPEKSDRITLFMKKFGIDPQKIQTRRSFIQDFMHTEIEDNTLFAKNVEYNPDLSERSLVAQSAFESAFESLYQDAVAPQHLLHVSCTHYESPSAAQKIVLDKAWPSVVTHLYHMGCYAALPGIRTAQALSHDGLVDIVHTEICSLHLNTDSYSPEQLVVQSLFADGAIKYSCSQEKPDSPCLEILSLHEMLVPDTQTDMTWKLHSDRFDMTLSKNVPKYLGEHLESFMKTLFEKAGKDYSALKEETIFAVHPGGPKIIDLAQELLELQDWQVENSKRVLAARGNMSSATLPHIWKDVSQEFEEKFVATVAFGPGLTMTGALLCL